MTTEKKQPTFVVRPLKVGPECYVLVTWADGLVEHVNGFLSAEEASRWIEADADEWLRKHPRRNQ
jgi:hypothetical protein